MKLLMLTIFILFAILFPAVLFAGSCESNGTGVEPDYYYIRLRLDSKEYILNFGGPEVSKYDPMAVLSTDLGVWIYFTGQNWYETNKQGDGSRFRYQII